MFLCVILTFFGVTNSYRTVENYCKRKLYKVSVVIAVKTRAFQIETKFSATAEVDNLLQHDTPTLYIKDLLKSWNQQNFDEKNGSIKWKLIFWYLWFWIWYMDFGMLGCSENFLAEVIITEVSGTVSSELTVSLTYLNIEYKLFIIYKYGWEST